VGFACDRIEVAHADCGLKAEQALARVDEEDPGDPPDLEDADRRAVRGWRKVGRGSPVRAVVGDLVGGR
jgi:hypothetical protein